MQEDDNIKTEIILAVLHAATRADELLTATQWDMPHPCRYSDELEALWLSARKSIMTLRQYAQQQSRELQ